MYWSLTSSQRRSIVGKNVNTKWGTLKAFCLDAINNAHWYFERDEFFVRFAIQHMRFNEVCDHNIQGNPYG